MGAKAEGLARELVNAAEALSTIIERGGEMDEAWGFMGQIEECLIEIEVELTGGEVVRCDECGSREVLMGKEEGGG